MGRRLPRNITQNEFEELLKATLKSKHKRRKEYALAMLLAFEGGMRISEILGLLSSSPHDDSWKVPPLTSNRVDLREHTIRIEQGKGTKDRIVPLPKRVNNAALTLLPLNKRITRRSLQRWVTNLGGRVLGKPISFHTLRHGFATHLVNSNRPIHEVQSLLGHAKLDTTSIYLHVNPKRAIEGARDVF